MALQLGQGVEAIVGAAVCDPATLRRLRSLRVVRTAAQSGEPWRRFRFAPWPEVGLGLK